MNRLELTPRGRTLLTLAGLALTASWLTGHDHVRLAAALLAAPLLVDLLWQCTSLPTLQVLVPERRTHAGMPFLEYLELANLSPRTPARELRLREPSTATPAGAAYVDRLEPGERIRLELPARVRRRGRLPMRTFTAVGYFPLGLIRHAVVLRADVALIAEPARVPLPAHVLDAARDDDLNASDDGTGLAEFHSLRDYATGEDARQVHALKSAAAGTLVRKVTRSAAQREACLVLDLRRPPGHHTGAGGRRLEWSLGVAASLVDELVQRRARVVCVALAAQPQTWNVDDATQARDFLAFLAEAQPCAYRPLDAAWLRALAEQRRCYWVPAGGLRARQERDLLGQPVLVTEHELR